MQINSVNNQNFGNLRIATEEQRQKILDNLDNEQKRYLLDSIKYDSFQAMQITKNGDVYIHDLAFEKPKKIEGDNLISKVRKGIEILWSEKYPSRRSNCNSNNNSYAGGEVASPGYCCGYGGYGCGW